MIEVRFHGRGGQGAVVASQILAEAAFSEGMDCQAFPYFGVERRGAPVTAFTKLDKQHIRDKSMVYEPDYVVVLEASLLTAVNVTEGLKKDGLILVNTEEDPDKIAKDLGVKRVACVNATNIAIGNRLGTSVQPIVNTAIVGAFAKATGVVTIDSVEKAIMQLPRHPEANAKAAKEAFGAVRTSGGE